MQQVDAGSGWAFRLRGGDRGDGSQPDFSVDLTAAQTQPIVLQGQRGLSLKSADAGSYYYSMPRLEVSGNLQLAEEQVAVSGLAWLDREWSTSVLPPGVSGWDWFALHLRDGRSVMAFRLRRADGGLDCMSVCVTLRDIFDVPVPNCTTSVTLNDTGNGSLCSCCPNPLILATDANGVAVFEFKKLGGRGTAEACITALCQGAIAIACQSFDYASTDMNGDCVGTDVIDLGLWAGCLPPAAYCRESDYNCDLTVDVIDLGLFAGGLTVTCADGAACR